MGASASGGWAGTAGNVALSTGAVSGREMVNKYFVGNQKP